MIIKHRIKCACFHLRVCGRIVEFMLKYGVTGTCLLGTKKADILSELSLVLLNARYGDELIFDIKCNNDVKSVIEEFVEGL